MPKQVTVADVYPKTGGPPLDSVVKRLLKQYEIRKGDDRVAGENSPVSETVKGG